MAVEWCRHVQNGHSEKRCEYVTNRLARAEDTHHLSICGMKTTHIVHFAGEDHPICKMHAGPQWHPKDLWPRIISLKLLDLGGEGDERRRGP